MTIFDPDRLQREVAALDEELGAPGVWDDARRGAKLAASRAQKGRRLDLYRRLETELEELPEMLPGSTREVTFRVPNVPRLGYLQAGVTLQPTVVAEALDPGPLALVARQASLAGMPWVALGVIALGLGLVMLARWRRAHLTRQAEEWVAYTRAEARRVADNNAAGTVANVTQ